MIFTQSSKDTIRNNVETSLLRYKGADADYSYTDIYIQPNQHTGEVLIFNDDDDVLASFVVQGLADKSYFEIEQGFRSVLEKMNAKKCFSDVRISMPFSFVLVDEDKETVSDLLLVDEDVIVLSDELLKGLDKELDEFLKELLEK